MAKLQFAVNEEAGELQDFDVIPGGKYRAHIVKSEKQLVNTDEDTKPEDREWYINFQWKILDGEYKGRVVFLKVNLGLKKETALEFARKQMNTLCKACGKDVIDDTEELHGIPCIIIVTIKKGKKRTDGKPGNYPDQNNVSNINSAGETSSSGDVDLSDWDNDDDEKPKSEDVSDKGKDETEDTSDSDDDKEEWEWD